MATIQLIDVAHVEAAALASAPVAGETVAWKVYDAGLNKHMLTDNPKVADMLRAEGGGNVVRPLVYGDAATQANTVAGEAQKPVAWLLETTPDGYALHRSFDFEEPPSGFPGLVRKTPLYAAPQASEAVRNALWTLTEHNALHFGERHNTVIQGRAALKADKDGGDCAKGGHVETANQPETRANIGFGGGLLGFPKGAGDDLVQEFIDATDALLASQERKTWTSGYKKDLTAGERIRIAERWRQLRAAMAAQKQGADDAAPEK